MMMTSGSAVHYKSMFDAGSQIIAKEGTKSLFKGAAANILRGVAGAGVLSLYDQLQVLMFGKVYSGGTFILPSLIAIPYSHGIHRLRINTLYSLKKHRMAVSCLLIHKQIEAESDPMRRSLILVSVVMDGFCIMLLRLILSLRDPLVPFLSNIIPLSFPPTNEAGT
jgi:hypothetical protein